MGCLKDVPFEASGPRVFFADALVFDVILLAFHMFWVYPLGGLSFFGVHSKAQ